MLESLYIGATGMQAQQANLDVIANNMANVNTAGFKRNRLDFEDLLYRALPGTNTAASPAIAGMGMGTSVATADKVFTVGDVKQTSQPYDLAIQGQGFFEVTLADGSSAYTRNGTLHVGSDGALVNQDGYPLAGKIVIPADATAVTIGSDGQVQAKAPSEPQPVSIGQIEVVTFVNPAGLKPIGDNLYVATTDGEALNNSGEPQTATPGQSGAGTLAQGYLEVSNVNLIDEMVNLVIAQRAYEVNSKVVAASDQLLSISNNLYR
jgi:flagellar basal-body rod protein FlgG